MNDTKLEEIKTVVKEIPKTNKQFKKQFAPSMFWDSRSRGTYDVGKNKAKRERRIKEKSNGK